MPNSPKIQIHQKYKYRKILCNSNRETNKISQDEESCNVAFQTDFYTIDLCLHTKFNNNANTQIDKIPNSPKNANTQIYKITNV